MQKTSWRAISSDGQKWDRICNRDCETFREMESKAVFCDLIWIVKILLLFIEF